LSSCFPLIELTTGRPSLFCMHRKCPWTDTVIQSSQFQTQIVGTDRLTFDGRDPSGQSNRWFSCIWSVKIMRGLTSRITQRVEVRRETKSQSPKDLKSRSFELPKSRSNEILPRHFGPILLQENFMPHNPKLPKPEVSKHVAHSSVMTCGTHSRSFGCVIHPFPRDTCHPSFHDTSTV
jgi:hypothetical protein